MIDGVAGADHSGQAVAVTDTAPGHDTTASHVGPPSRWATVAASAWLWVVRAAWVVVGAAGWSVVEQISESRGHWSLGALGVATGTAWLIGVIGLAALSTIGLTATRVVIPLSAVFAAVAVSLEPGIESMVLALAAVVATVGVCSGDYGQRFVQSSAYGDEHRFALRPPAGYLVAATIAWLVWAGLSATMVGAFTTGRWWVGGVLGVLWVAATVTASLRWHLLSTRWLVLVPAGVVVHDRLVLAETIMLKRSQIAHLSLAETTSTAIDITGPSSGHAIEIRSRDEFAIVRAPRRGQAATPETTAAILVAPTRPGRALEASHSRAISVGAPD